MIEMVCLFRMVWVAIYLAFGVPALFGVVLAFVVAVRPFVHALNELRSEPAIRMKYDITGMK
jgi:hypothetical protein